MPENKDEIYDSGGHLFWATKDNRSDIVRALLDRGAEVEAKCNAGWRPLHRANLIYYPPIFDQPGGKCEVARLLIEHGANTDGIDLGLMDDQEDA